MATSETELTAAWARPEWGYLTPGIPGLAGRYRVTHEDFVVDEELHPDDGIEGDHLQVRIEKRGLTTDEAIHRLARRLGVRPGDVGRAGRKDARGVTRQWLSVEHAQAAALSGFESPGLVVLEHRRRRRKLRLGAFRRNRFRLRLRGGIAGRLEEVQGVLAEVARRGLPNYFGPQRFGQRGDNALVGLHLVRGEADAAVSRILGHPGPRDSSPVEHARGLAREGRFAEARAAFPAAFRTEARLAGLMADRRGRAEGALRALGRRPLGLYVSAFQSHLFNAVLSRRLMEPERVLAGDLLLDPESGRLREIASPDEAAPGSPTGPLPGPRLRFPEADAGRLEEEVLSEHDSDPRNLDEGGFLGFSGSRRPLYLEPEDVASDTGSDEHGPWLELRFALPPGSFATALLRELGKGHLEAET